PADAMTEVVFLVPDANTAASMHADLSQAVGGKPRAEPNQPASPSQRISRGDHDQTQTQIQGGSPAEQVPSVINSVINLELIVPQFAGTAGAVTQPSAVSGQRTGRDAEVDRQVRQVVSGNGVVLTSSSDLSDFDAVAYAADVAQRNAVWVKLVVLHYREGPYDEALGRPVHVSFHYFDESG